MRKLASIGSLTLAGTLTGALMAYAVPSAFASDDPAFKRNEDTPDVVTTVDDDDDDDSRAGRDDTSTNGGGDNSSFNSGTGNSNDGTNSRETRVSRDRDLSRDDLTKDWTRDGGDRTRDHSQNRTNDRSRNDTR